MQSLDFSSLFFRGKFIPPFLADSLFSPKARAHFGSLIWRFSSFFPGTFLLFFLSVAHFAYSNFPKERILGPPSHSFGGKTFCLFSFWENIIDLRVCSPSWPVSTFTYYISNILCYIFINLRDQHRDVILSSRT